MKPSLIDQPSHMREREHPHLAISMPQYYFSYIPSVPISVLNYENQLPFTPLNRCAIRPAST